MLPKNRKGLPLAFLSQLPEIKTWLLSRVRKCFKGSLRRGESEEDLCSPKVEQWLEKTRASQQRDRSGSKLEETVIHIDSKGDTPEDTIRRVEEHPDRDTDDAISYQPESPPQGPAAGLKVAEDSGFFKGVAAV